ncbi:undecaprenyldiphospho-muramoylpentapeptide beta-N-acetylglucosaminyltransferase [Kyrpidia sp.]|uniref:undecaprenyldiphospho-muramoylpentapeptide beta-N-acetylglucosaminyltransferase n=1 Tax=Kyrpidia sp. TaxID=2073077 RepID=UPI002584CAE9|nr:undecaprenyldiphospho-muramoylpentapeptide beta-N-acetylglucosaminyltransferase [Kyrpidia sp.]MCL6575478.1 undecaprenyldiphospho-muramoylpentapeptide beta-N-acetylglucosaminyltransferase [Kyrpidia sp.]
MRVLLTGGGTGGHIYPALALARDLRRRVEDLELLYVGTPGGMEKELVPREGIPFTAIDVRGLPRRPGLEQVRALWQAWRSLGQAKGVLRRFRPNVVVGTGGYVSGPVVFMAHRMGIPTLIHEQNVVPGLTNRLLSRVVDAVAVSFPDTSAFPKAKRVVITGNPRASELVEVQEDRVEAIRREYGLKTDRPAVVIVSGSRGAAPINRAAQGLLPKLKGAPFQLVWVTGRAHFEDIERDVERQFGKEKVEGVTIVPFCHDMPALLHAVDCVVCRAGASTVAELTAAGTPAILIPSPYVAGRHQERNARWLAEREAAVVLPEDQLTPDELFRRIIHILGRDEAKEMSRRSRELGLVDAARTLSLLVVSLASAKGRQ